jgi:CHC2 zinc finger.
MKDQTEKIEAIKKLDVVTMKSLLEYEPHPVELKSEKELYDYINSIDLEEYLGIHGKVCCILPDHDDHTPSAHVYTTDDKTQIYKCFGCNHAYTIVSITEKLARCKRHKAIEFIKKVYNLELVQSDWVMEQKQLMIDSANYLDSNDFKITFPELSKLIRTRKHHIKAMLLHFSQYVNDGMCVNEKPFFYASYNMLMNVCGIKGDRNALSQSLTLFALLNMVTKLQIEDIPEKQLNKAREIAAQYKLKKLTGFYSFEEYGTILFEQSEGIARTLKENSITLKGLSREYILRTFDPNLADKIFPQYKRENRKGNSPKSDEHTLDITECLFYLLDKKGYATEKEIVHMLGNKYSYDQTEIQIKKSLQEMMLAYGLVRVKASGSNKMKYGITDNEISYQSYIICRDII